MRNKVGGIFLLVAVVSLAFVGAACSASTKPPSDKDIIKAIDASGIMKRADGSIEVVPPVIIAERGQRNKDGSWPVKVTFMLTYKMSEGQKSPPMKTTTLFRIFRGKDKVGKSVWQAQLGS